MNNNFRQELATKPLWQEFLDTYIRPVRGGIEVLTHLVCVADGTTSAFGQGYELPITRPIPGNDGRLWRPGYDPVGHYAIHKLVKVEGNKLLYMGDVNNHKEVRQLWELDKAVVEETQRQMDECHSLYPEAEAMILPRVILVREDKTEEWLEQIRFLRVSVGEVANIHLFIGDEKVKGFYFKHESRDGIPVVEEYIHKGGTYVGGSVGNGGGFYVR
jgi:hypothetical protein